MNTLTQPRARHTDPTTSHAAAQDVKPRTLPVKILVLDIAMNTDFKHNGFTQRRMVSRYIYLHGQGWHDKPATDSSIRTRVHELVEEGYIEDSGEKVKGPGGRMEIVWKLRP